MHDIGTLGGSFAEGRGINASGYVAGFSDTAGGPRHAFLYDGSTMHDLNTLVALTDPLYGLVTFAEALGINDANQIVAIGGGRTYLLTPEAENAPEPASLVLLGTGALGMLCARRRMKTQAQDSRRT
jgi:probable HAF family extracellular repeat protein